MLPIALRIRGSGYLTVRDVNFRRDRGWCRQPLNIVDRSNIASVLDKFKDSPVLVCRDTEIIARGPEYVSGCKLHWAPRRYAHVWDVFANVGMGQNWGFSSQPMDWSERFSLLPKLVSRLLEVAQSPEWRTTSPKTPFSLVRLHDFEFSDSTLPCDTVESLPVHLNQQQRFQTRFDGVESCSLFVDCHLPCKSESRYCSFHAEAAKSISPKVVVKKRVQTRLSLLRTRISGNLQVQEQLETLRRYKTIHSLQTWIIDMEFVSLKCPKSAIPVQISIQDLTGKELLYTNIDYEGMTWSTFGNMIRERLSTKGDHIPRILGFASDGFGRCYQGEATNDMSIPAIADKINDLGYSPQTHKLLDSGNGVDRGLFARILSRDHSLVVEKSNLIATGVNTLCLAKKMLPNDTCMKLSEVHSRLCPSTKAMKYHLATTDTFALYEVIEEMLSCPEMIQDPSGCYVTPWLHLDHDDLHEQAGSRVGPCLALKDDANV